MKRLSSFVLASAVLLAAGVTQAAEPLVDVNWVKSSIGKPGVVFLDVRGKLAGASKADYLRAHIPGAVWTNYLKDGWRVKDSGGTVGMLPPVAKLEKLIGGLGIDNSSHVVVVPLGGKALDMGTATRIYWTFKVLGHDNVSVLDGGMRAYTKDVDKATKKPVNPLEKGLVKTAAKTFKGSLRKEMIVTKQDVKKALDADIELVDNRPNNQFLGINRHGMSKRSGTIPNAKNMPENWMTKNGGGSFRDKASLAKLFKLAGVSTSGDQITFCNTGHWASLGWFVNSEIMGNKKTRMYDGSMVEWSADKAMPMQSAVNLQ